MGCSSSPRQVLISRKSHPIASDFAVCYLPQTKDMPARHAFHENWTVTIGGRTLCVAGHLITAALVGALPYRAKVSDQSPTTPERGNIGCVRACSSIRLPETPREEAYQMHQTTLPRVHRRFCLAVFPVDWPKS